LTKHNRQSTRRIYSAAFVFSTVSKAGMSTSCDENQFHEKPKSERRTSVFPNCVHGRRWEGQSAFRV